jgi:hypothetical protein
MTAEEREFAILIDNYNNAKIKYDQAHRDKQNAPSYAADNGVISVASIVRHKAELAQYDLKKGQATEATSDLAAARAALEAYFPDAVKQMFGRGVAMVTSVPQGAVAILKQGNDYLLFYGQNEREARQSMTSRPPTR